MKAALMKDMTISGKLVVNLQAISLLINKISLSKLIEGGAAILQIDNINHQRAMEGIICRSPLQISILRVEVRSKTMFVKQNIPDEHSPCAIINVKHPEAPVFLPTIIPPITRLIWATDEYATRLLVSVCRRHINLTTAPPSILIVTHIRFMWGD